MPDFPWNFWQPAKFHARMAEEALRTPLPAMIASVLLALAIGTSPSMPDFPWNFWQPAKFHARMAEEALRTPLLAMIASVLH